MVNDLLVSLRKYIPRIGKDPIENFFTEVFSWIIGNNESLAKIIIWKMLGKEVEIKTEIKCSTQVNFDGFYPDMLIEFNDMVIISEHKVWASLQDNQIEKYRDYAEKNNLKFKIVLITATSAQHISESSDINLCWSDFYEIINDWAEKTKESENYIVISSFLKLLKDEGVGPTLPVQFSSIQYYNTAKL